MKCYISIEFYIIFQNNSLRWNAAAVGAGHSLALLSVAPTYREGVAVGLYAAGLGISDDGGFHGEAGHTIAHLLYNDFACPVVCSPKRRSSKQAKQQREYIENIVFGHNGGFDNRTCQISQVFPGLPNNMPQRSRVCKEGDVFSKHSATLHWLLSAF